jgi:TrmH family RNA methyltransferase
MLSKNKKKLISSLYQKKYRNLHGLFIAEGHKLNADLLSAGAGCIELFTTREWSDQNEYLIPHTTELSIVTMSELKSISNLKSPPPVIGIYKINKEKINIETLQSSLTLALDEIQDPGNLGTIVRIADWFGIKHIVCSENTADIYNPKVVQATMGAIARVKIFYTDLNTIITEYKKTSDLPVYGTFLDGENIYTKTLSEKGLIIMGNEGKGISKDLEMLTTDKLYIPAYPPGIPTSESLNVAVATAVVCSEFRRRELI